jgi:uncharacterized protein (TIGR04255 family)
MENVRACNKDHSIQVVAFVIEFIDELSTASIHNIIKLYEENPTLKDIFSSKHEQMGVTIKIDESGQQVSSNSLAGVAFESTEKDWAIQVRRDAILVTCRKYTRWDKIWKKVKEIFSLFIPYIEVRSNLIILEYVDEYNIDNIESGWQKTLFNKESKYLSPRIFTDKSLWHLYQGFFINGHTEIPSKLLTNLNLDCIERDNSTSLAVRTQHKTILENDVLLTELENYIEPLFAMSHDVNKDILLDLLSSEILREINLQGESHE